MVKEYKTIKQISDASILVQQVYDVRCGEQAEILLPDGDVRYGTVISVDGHSARVRVFAGTRGMDVAETKVRFSGRNTTLSLSCDILGRVFDGVGRAIDGGARIVSDNKTDIYVGSNEGVLRSVAAEKNKAEISVSDEHFHPILGQKMALISHSGLPYIELALQVARSFSDECRSSKFAIVIADMGATVDEADIFSSELRRMGLADRTVAFVNRSSDPAGERLLTPHMAMTAAEYLAFECDMKVLVIMTEISAYGAAHKSSCFNEKLISRTAELEKRTLDELCNDALERELSRIFERSGVKKGSDGSITLLPVLASCDDDASLAQIVKRLTDVCLVP